MKDEEILNLVGKTAERIGYKCFIVGGYVRDKLLGIPNTDMDFVVLGSGVKMAEEFSKDISYLNPQSSYFKNFGTAQVKFGNIEVEFVGARKESYQRGSRKPIVENGTLDDDLERRDFTINALAVCVNPGEPKNLIDKFNGESSLKNRIIQTPLEPGRTFSDDPLRMLRAVRFACKLDFHIEEKTWQGIVNNAERLKIVSPERIVVELNKILLSGKPDYGFELLEESGLLKIFLPELSNLDISGEGHKNNFYHSCLVLRQVSEKSGNLWLRWAALLHDIGKTKTARKDEQGNWTFYQHELVGAKMIQPIFHRLHLPEGEEMRYVEKLVELHMRPGMISTKVITDSAVRRLISDSHPYTEDLMLLGRCDLSSQNPETRKHVEEHYDKLEKMIKDLIEKDAYRTFQPVLNGNDIMEIFNLEKGPLVGKIKQTIKEAILDGQVNNTKEDLIEYIKSNKLL